MGMPGYTAECSLHKAAEYSTFISALGSAVSHRGITPAGLDDLVCKALPWLCGNAPQPPQCLHVRTETKCAAVALLCNDRSLCSDGTHKSSGWYPCGVCFGFG